jgi:hypothetical protein
MIGCLHPVFPASKIAGCWGIIPLHPAIFEAGNTGCVVKIQRMEINPLAALHTTPDFPLLLTQSNPPARISLPPLWSAPMTTGRLYFEKEK